MYIYQNYLLFTSLIYLWLFCLHRHVAQADAVTRVTPIMVAVETGNLEMIQELVLTGVPLHTADARGLNVFHYAAKGGNQKVIQVG